MAQKYLILASDLKELGFIQGNVNESKLITVIKRVQDMYIEDILGTTLYEKLLSDTPTFSGIYATLMSDYVTPCMVAYCDYESVIFLNIKMTAKNVGKVDDQATKSTGEDEMSRIEDRLYKHAMKYKNRLAGYLKDNENDIPEYQNWVASFKNVKPHDNQNSGGFKFAVWKNR